MVKVGEKRVFVIINIAEEEESACKSEPVNSKVKKNVIKKTKSRVIKTIAEPPKTKREVKKKSSSLKHPPTYSEISRVKRISQEQINQLIGYIVDDGMTITAASAKANMGLTAGSSYYRRYMNDPNGNIPITYSPAKSLKICTTSQITQLIHYIEHDHLSITKAAEKAAMGASTGLRYYNKYITDPNRNIPIPREKTAPVSLCTKDQVKRLIHHIKHDNMTT
jgi:hypothetical protein